MNAKGPSFIRLLLTGLIASALVLMPALPAFADSQDFAEGLQQVKQNGLWGYINRFAQWVIEPRYDNASSFRDGLALVEKDGKLLYIDHEGNVVWQEK